MRTTPSPFKVGDRFELVKTFRCDGDGDDLDDKIDKALRARFAGTPTGAITEVYDNTRSRVAFDPPGAIGGRENYMVNNDCLAHEIVVTPEDEEAAIASILQALKP